MLSGIAFLPKFPTGYPEGSVAAGMFFILLLPDGLLCGVEDFHGFVCASKFTRPTRKAMIPTLKI
jgi:hypothetical protein